MSNKMHSHAVSVQQDVGDRSPAVLSSLRDQREISQPTPTYAKVNTTSDDVSAIRHAAGGVSLAGLPLVSKNDTSKQMNGNSSKVTKEDKKRKKKNKSDVIDGNSGKQGLKASKSKNVVEELKIFQNSNLLNQQDPLEQLQQQLNQLISDDAGTTERPGLSMQQHNTTREPLAQLVTSNQASLSLQSTQIYPHEIHALDCNVSANMFTVKKGVLWQQQDFDKFHQRLFSRWKKRFFILTTDYLVCFKRSTSKVGRSEMGKFLYKTSLGDILSVDWLRPKKSDKGAIILRMKDKFNLFLWSKDNLDEWMTLIESMRLKRKLRGSPTDCPNQASNQNGIYENAALPAVRDGLVRNQTSSHGNIDLALVHDRSTEGDQVTRQLELSASSEQASKATSFHQVVAPSEHFNQGLIERSNQNGGQQQTDETGGSNNVAPRHESVVQRGKIGEPLPHRPLTNMINDDGAAVPAQDGPFDRKEQNLSSDDVAAPSSETRQDDKYPRDQVATHKASTSSASSTSRSSSVKEKRPEETRHDSHELRENTDERKTICRDSNDNLVLLDARSRPGLVQSPLKERRISAKWQVTHDSESRDKQHMEPNGAIEWTQDKQMVRESPHQLIADVTEEGRSRIESEAVGQRADVRQSVKQERPITNLIRRDDSWHSLLSLNQIGHNHMQAAKRSLYAKHIMPTTATDHQSKLLAAQENGGTSERFQQHSRFNPIESTATPLRERQLIRQQSMQVQNSRRPLPTREQQQANSFDVAQIPGSPSQHFNNQLQQQPPTSYHQKLLQLQLLHNSNNIDYVRNNVGQNNNDRSTNNDYQIYGPGSIATTNHYGYYSMRSNLKSAASEFSFIRPNSSDLHPSVRPANPQQIQSGHLSDVSGKMDQSQQLNINRTSLALTQRQLLDYGINCNNLPNSPSSRGQNFIDERNGKHSKGSPHELATDFMAPNRDLPLKPNKKRQQLAGAMEAQSQKSSSTTFGSSIVHFFRRAFSKRSKRRPKLAESCSSSLGGALDEKFESIQRTRSAFSTSEGMRVTDRLTETTDQQQQSAIQQRHRMIDMIEAFANKTAIDQETYNKLSQQNRTDSAQYLSSMRSSIQNDTSKPVKSIQHRRQQFAGSSPLHKSNSISTSTGLNGLNEMMRLNERQMLVNDPISPSIRAGQRNSGPMSSPMVTRSTKVMSAHLTPLFNRKETNEYEGGYFVSSPRHSTNLEHLPRPSSIYGQPSMISSPVSSNVRDPMGNEFGSHRSSIHSYHQRSNRGHLSSNHNDARRHHHQAIKTSFLDTTREVAEEVSSPTIESKDFIDREVRADRHLAMDDRNRFKQETTTPMNYPHRQHQERRNIVNPILQSPTMSLIYDNHPMIANGGNGVYSHYDNHRPIEYQQSMSSMDLSVHSYSQSIQHNNLDPVETRYRRTNNDCNAIVSPLVSSRNSKMRQSYNVGTNHAGDLATPSHSNIRLTQQQQQQISSDGCYSSNADRNVSGYVKPSTSMIGPATPISRRGLDEDSSLPYNGFNSDAIIDSPVISQFNPYSRANSRPNSIVKLSSNKPTEQPHSHYQQSPLVNRLTRVVNRGDGVQTTVIHPEVPAHNNQKEAVVNIVGAPGINLEPSLAHSLLRGTNINAFESSAVGLHSSSNRANANTKTFLVSSRLSKTINESPSPNAESNIGRLRTKTDNSNRKVEHEQSRDEEPSSRSTSSGTDPISTSSSDRGVRRKTANDSGSKSFQVDEENRDNSINVRNRKESQSRSSNDRRRGSSTEHSDELSSQAESFDEPLPEERKWVTSKLTQ